MPVRRHWARTAKNSNLLTNSGWSKGDFAQTIVTGIIKLQEAPNQTPCFNFHINRTPKTNKTNLQNHYVGFLLLLSQLVETPACEVPEPSGKVRRLRRDPWLLQEAHTFHMGRGPTTNREILKDEQNSLSLTALPSFVAPSRENEGHSVSEHAALLAKSYKIWSLESPLHSALTKMSDSEDSTSLPSSGRAALALAHHASRSWKQVGCADRSQPIVA